MSWKDFQFPPVLSCTLCGCSIRQNYFCQNCIESLEDGVLWRVTPYGHVVALQTYTYPLHNIISHWKTGQRPLGHALGKALQSIFVYFPLLGIQPEAIAYCPGHPTNNIQRGFDPAQDIAIAIAKKLKKPLYTPYFRHPYTLAQKNLSRLHRLQNMHNAIRWTDTAIQYKEVLVIDDITTTGATIDTIAKGFTQRGCKAHAIVLAAHQPSSEFTPLRAQSPRLPT